MNDNYDNVVLDATEMSRIFNDLDRHFLFICFEAALVAAHTHTTHTHILQSDESWLRSIHFPRLFWNEAIFRKVQQTSSNRIN